MHVNVIITPKKNEVVECTTIFIIDGCLKLSNMVKRGRGSADTPVAGFKKWIRFYVLPPAKKEK